MTGIAKPRLRGIFHLWAFFVAVAARGGLVVLAGAMPRFAAWVYVTALAAMFGASALYHRYPFKSAARRVWARRLDHSTIFVFIAGTYTPFALLAFDGTISWIVLATVWVGAALGLVLNFFWLQAPRWVTQSGVLRRRLGRRDHDPADALGRRRAGLGARDGRRGALYVGSAHLRVPLAEPVPATFGFHEIFHVLVIAAAVTQFVAVSLVVL